MMLNVGMIPPACLPTEQAALGTQRRTEEPTNAADATAKTSQVPKALGG